MAFRRKLETEGQEPWEGMEDRGEVGSYNLIDGHQDSIIAFV